MDATTADRSWRSRTAGDRVWPMTQFPRAKTGTGPQSAADAPTFQAFREVPRTGVIFVTTEAQRRGYSPSSDDWCNLGQGMPEAEALPGAPPRISELPVLDG